MTRAVMAGLLTAPWRVSSQRRMKRGVKSEPRAPDAVGRACTALCMPSLALSRRPPGVEFGMAGHPPGAKVSAPSYARVACDYKKDLRLGEYKTVIGIAGYKTVIACAYKTGIGTGGSAHG